MIEVVGWVDIWTVGTIHEWQCDFKKLMISTISWNLVDCGRFLKRNINIKKDLIVMLKLTVKHFTILWKRCCWLVGLQKK
jgi:hypothetical protein